MTMEAFAVALLAYAPAAIVGGIALLVALVLLRSVRTERPLALGRMLERQGASAGPVFSPAEARKLAEAARRCANCGTEKVCGEYLDSGKRADYSEFCPNAAYIEGLKRSN
jgi:hypothetical protein